MSSSAINFEAHAIMIETPKSILVKTDRPTFMATKVKRCLPEIMVRKITELVVIGAQLAAAVGLLERAVVGYSSSAPSPRRLILCLSLFLTCFTPHDASGAGISTVTSVPGAGGLVRSAAGSVRHRTVKATSPSAVMARVVERTTAEPGARPSKLKVATSAEGRSAMT